MTNSQAPSLKALDLRGIGLFLGLCFGLTWTIEISALAYGIRFNALSPAAVALLGLVMLIPAGSAFSVRRWLTREGLRERRSTTRAVATIRVRLAGSALFVWCDLHPHRCSRTRRVQHGPRSLSAGASALAAWE